MAHGHQDYIRGINIAYQTLTRQIVQPTYGGAQNSRDTVEVEANSWTTLVSVGGKGICYGGYVHVHYTSIQKNSLVKIEYDGALTASKSFYILNHNSLDKPTCCPIFILKYDDIIFNYSVGLQSGITFDSSLKLFYKEVHGGTPNVNYNLIYAKV